MSTTCSNWALSNPTSSLIRSATSRLRVRAEPATPASSSFTADGSSTVPPAFRVLGRDWAGVRVRTQWRPSASNSKVTSVVTVGSAY
jgi:hypothetical protein